MADAPYKHLNYDYEQEHSFDLVARVRAARETAEQEMRRFGNVAEYEVRKIYGQRSDLNYDDESVPGLSEHPVQVRNDGQIASTQVEGPRTLESQASLDFEQNGLQRSSANQDEVG